MRIRHYEGPSFMEGAEAGPFSIVIHQAIMKVDGEPAQAIFGLQRRSSNWDRPGRGELPC
jgi:hypothetical protein